MGGGVIYLPKGNYAFEDFIKLENAVILRGSGDLGAKISFPKYEPVFKGKGTPIETAFKGIVLADSEKAANCGLVNLAIDHGHIHFGESADNKCGGNRIVYGCVITSAADAGATGSKKVKQPEWQRCTARHHAAFDVKFAENTLIAHNRLLKSGQDNFTMKDYVLESPKGEEARFDVVFDLRGGESQQREPAVSKCDHSEKYHAK